MTKFQWHTIDKYEDLDQVLKDSHQSDQVILKHSNTCGISVMVKNRIEKEGQDSEDFTDIHIINVLSSRQLSNQLSELLSVRHESPQILLISEGRCTFHTSHFDVSLKNIPVHREE